MTPRFLVSACLAGRCCRYDGKANTVPEIARLAAEGLCLPVCPEVLGGLPVPRTPCEIRGGKVLTKEGLDCTEAFARGAREALRLAKEAGLTAAVLKSRSPSCGAGRIYDGTFSRRLTDGDGLLAALLKKEGFLLCTEENFRELLLLRLAQPDGSPVSGPSSGTARTVP